MTKSLVLANEEKAAVVAQLESAIRVAALLSKQIEDLSSSLDVVDGESRWTRGRGWRRRSWPRCQHCCKDETFAKLTMPL
jgi:hypothetical protein